MVIVVEGSPNSIVCGRQLVVKRHFIYLKKITLTLLFLFLFLFFLQSLHTIAHLLGDEKREDSSKMQST